MVRTDLNPGCFSAYVLFMPLGINCIMCALTDAVNSYGAITALFSMMWLVREACNKSTSASGHRLTLTEVSRSVLGMLILTQFFYTILMCLILPRLAGTTFARWIKSPGGLVWCGLVGAFSFPEGVSFESLKILQAIPSVALPSALRLCGMDCTACDLGIMVGDRYYPVVPTCAGTTCLGASLLLSIAIIGVRRRPLLQGTLLLFFATITAVFANQIRVLSLIFLDQAWRGSVENAVVHDLTGSSVYLCEIVVLLAFDAWLNLIPSKVSEHAEQSGHCGIRLEFRYGIAVLCVVLHVLCGIVALQRIRLDGYRAVAFKRSALERANARTLINVTVRESRLTSLAADVRSFHEEPRRGMWSEGMIVDLPHERWIVRLDGLFQQPHHLDLCYRLRGDRLLSSSTDDDGIELRHYRTTSGQDRLLAYSHVGSRLTPLSHSTLAVQAKYFTEMSWLSRELLSFSFGNEIYESGIIQIQVQCLRHKKVTEEKVALQPAGMVAILKHKLNRTPLMLR